MIIKVPVTLFHLFYDSNLPVRVGVCVPRDADLWLKGSYPTWKNGIDRWTELASLAELDSTQDMQSYYWDRNVG